MEHSDSLEIPLGSTADERLFSLIICAVSAFGGSFSVFAFEAWGSGDAWDQMSICVYLCFSSVFVLFGLILVPRTLLAPRPLVLSWDLSSLTFDTGRPGLLYLSDRFEHRPQLVYSAIFQRRKIIRITMHELKTGECSILMPSDCLTVTITCSGAQTNFGWAAPYHDRILLRETIKTWLKMNVTKR